MGTVYNRGTKKSPNWWITWLDPGGRRRYRKVGADRVLAKRVLAKVETDIVAGKYGVESDPDAKPVMPTVAEVMTSWVAKRTETHRSGGDDVCRARVHLLPYFGRMRLDEVGPAQLKAFIEKKRATLNPATIVRCLRLLSRFYSSLMEDGMELTNPVARLNRATRRAIGPMHDPRRTSFLKTKQDIRAVYLALPALAPNKPVRAMFAVGAFAGLRTDEILGLPKENVDLERRTIMVDRSARGPLKDNESRIAPINDSLLQVLREWLLMAPPGPLMFPPTKGRGAHMRPHTLHRHLKRAFATCRLPAMTWYQATRHTFASHYVMDRGTIEKLSLILGHSSIVTTQRYAHLVPGQFDQRDFQAACADISEPRVLPFDGSKKGPNCYAGVTQGEDAGKEGS
ncbi:MAG: site-specific integrase [Deltaproteobacteria bacterium]|nr:site-specific integrase [Deltaproteobacteria bacterium]